MIRDYNVGSERIRYQLCAAVHEENVMAKSRIRVDLLHHWSGSILLLAFCLYCFVTTALGANPKHRTNDRISATQQQFFPDEKGLERLAQLGIDKVVFVTRLGYDDSHWYPTSDTTAKTRIRRLMQAMASRTKASCTS